MAQRSSDKPPLRWSLTALLSVLLSTAAVLRFTGCESPQRHAPGPAPAPPPAVQRDLAALPLYQFTSVEFDRYLAALAARPGDLRQRVVHLARKNLGQPYEMYLLGEFPYELHDPDPLFNLARSDCLTFVEHTCAAALADGFWSYLRNLQRIRYRDGVISMLTRNHYTEADWNPNNEFLLEDLTDRLAPQDAPAHLPLRATIRRAAFFKQFGIGQDTPDQPFLGTFIPTANVPRILSALCDADIIEIVRGDDDSQWVGHVGFFVRGADGAANLLHSAHPQVREQDLLEYLASNKRCVGIKVLRLRPDAAQCMAAALQRPGATPVDAPHLAAALTAQRLEGYSYDWQHGMNLQAFRLDADAAPDAALQQFLSEAEQAIAAELGIPAPDRAIGVVDLKRLRYAAVGPDTLFYGASVPKICVALAYLERFHPDGDVPDAVRRELQRVIKRSDNDLAAKYSQLVGLEYIQKLVTSPKYRLYDAERGGGLWCGKHYGRDEPRIGDPLADHSHAATVRQCLRFYLLLEQLKLGSPRLCAELRSIFAAPDLPFHHHAFVRGLAGRDLTLIRKSGWWEDWRLDTARVEHNGMTYLLAGAAHHPRSGEYLARLAAAIDEHLCGPDAAPPAAAHVLFRFEAPAANADAVDVDPSTRWAAAPQRSDSASGDWLGPVTRAPFPFNEALVSWNIAASAPSPYALELRVGRVDEDRWSPWLRIGSAGGFPADDAVSQFDLAIDEDEVLRGRIDVDYFRSDDQFTGFQYRVRSPAATLDVRRVAVCLSDTTGIPRSAPAMPQSSAALAVRGDLRLPVPFRSQRAATPELRSRTCSPTSLAMVLQYRGVDVPTPAVCERVFDPANDIYGNWPLNVQAAFEFGVPGYLVRCSTWDQVRQFIAAGQPLIISIRSGVPGELRGAPYRTTDGHLLVLCGLTADGAAHVNDPAAPTAAAGMLKYRCEDLERVWLRRSGVAYVLLPPEQGGSAAAAAAQAQP